MRWALRRILWIVPTLAIISIAAFWALTRGTGQSERIPDLPRDDRARELPRFFNPEPQSVRELALAATNSIAADDRDAADAKVLLARLGGAALPHVLPALDALSPNARARVALALAPIARRMGVGSDDDLDRPEAAVVFWTRFWQDRAIDFRPAVVKRAVRRLALRATPGRHDDIRQLDTFALPELLAEMAPVRDPSDVVRARRLAAAAAHVTALDWTIPEDASVEDAADVVATWERWWVESRADYVTLDGARRMLAMVTETQYGRWAAEAARTRLGISASGEPVLDVLAARAPMTLWLIASGLLGGYALGVVWGMMGAAFARRRADVLSSAAAVALAALPLAAIAGLCAPGVPSAGGFLPALLMILVTGALVSRHQRAATRVALDQEYARTLRAFGASPARLARLSLRSSSVAVVSLLGVDLPALVTAAFVLEHAFSLFGLGPVTLDAVGSRDVAWLMAIALLSAALVAVAQIASDALLGAIDPRVQSTLARQRGAAG